MFNETQTQILNITIKPKFGMAGIELACHFVSVLNSFPSKEAPF